MGLESPTFISQLKSEWPLSGDETIQGDNHIRNNKHVLKSTFPGEAGQGFSKAIVATEDELNNLSGLNEPLSTYIGTVVSETDDIVGEDQIIDGSVTSPKLSILSLQQAGLVPTAWVVFNGDGSINADQTLMGQLNVSVVHQEGTNGSYTITFSSPLANSNYVINVTGQRPSGAVNNDMINMVSRTVSPDVNGFRIITRDLSNTGVKAQRIYITVFGGR